MAKRKRSRMHTRAERKQNREQLIKEWNNIPQTMHDRRRVLSYDATGRTWDSEVGAAEAWLGLREEMEQNYLGKDERKENLEMMRALERRFQVLTGDALTKETAEDYIEGEQERAFEDTYDYEDY
jgi:hypothetical protein